MILFFFWIAWIWMLILIFSDVFRRDMSGWAKAGWCLFVLVLPFLGAFVYLIANGKDLTERRIHDAQASQANLDQHIRSVARRLGGRDRARQAAARQRRHQPGRVRAAQGQSARLSLAPRENGETRAPRGFRDGRYWARTSDLRLVEAALSQLS